MPDQVYYIGPATTIQEVLQRLSSHQGYMSVDTETVSTSDQRMVGIGFGLSATEAVYFMAFEDQDNPNGHSRSPHFQTAIATLADARPKIWYNISFDQDVYEPFTGPLDNWQDVAKMLQIQGLWNALDENCVNLLGKPHLTIQQLLVNVFGDSGFKNKKMTDLDAVALADKCCHDCMDSYALYELIGGPRWHDQQDSGFIWRDFAGRPYDVTAKMKKAYALDRALAPILNLMGKKGLKLSKDRLLSHYEKLAEEKFRYEAICQQMFGFNPGSNQQAGYVLALRGNMIPFTQTRGRNAYKQLKVDGDTLLSLDDPLAHIILQYRTRADQLSDVIEPYLGKPKGPAGKKIGYRDWVFPERATTHWRMDLATSRLASFKRNLQNITPRLRDIFEPEPLDGEEPEFTWWDLSQIEMRIFAHKSQDPELLGAYARKESIHMMTMQALFPGIRRYDCCLQDKCTCGRNQENPVYTDSKTFNFAMIYNAIAKTLAAQTKRSIKTCEELRLAWLAKYHVGHSWMIECMEHSVDHDWIETEEGRRMRLPPVEQQGEHHRATCDINYRVQGLAAWPIKQSMLRSHEVYSLDQRLQVHDEVLINGRVEIPAEFATLLPGIETPFEVYHGKVWV